MDLLDAKKELAVWRQLSFHIDKALDALEGSSAPQLEGRLAQLWEDALVEETERLRAMRTVSPDLQYLALRGEKVLQRMERRVLKLKSPPWWQFWRKSDFNKAEWVTNKAEGICKGILRKGRRVLRATNPVNAALDQRSLTAVHRTPLFLTHPELLKTLSLLASKRRKLRERESYSELEKLDQIDLLLADLLHQRDEFSLDEKLGALKRISDQINSLF